MRLLPYILFILPLLLTVSCRRDDDAIAVMARAEAVMDSLPDSALALMRTVSRDALRSREGRALYALTMSRALDRNDILVASDSIIAPAVGYYRPDRDPLRHAMTQYYLGRTHFHAGDYGNSIIAYLEGLETAEADSLFFWAGMCARGISYDFNRTDNGAQEKVYADLSYEYFRKTPKKLHTLYALMDKGVAMMNSGKEREALNIFDTIEIESTELSDSAIWAEVLGYKVRALYIADSTERAVSYGRTLLKTGRALTTDSAYLALSYAHIGNIDSTRIIYEYLKDRIPECESTIRYYLLKSAGEFDAALEAMREVNGENYNRYFAREKNDLSYDIIDYYQKGKIIRHNELIASRRLSMAMIVCVILIIILLSITILDYRNFKRRQEEKHAMLIVELKRSSEENDRQKSSAQAALLALLRSRYSIIDELCQTHPMNGDRADDSKAMLKKASQIVASYVDSESGFNEMEQIVDKYYGNIFSDFKKDMPSVTKKEYRLFVFSVLGFSPSVIALFMSENRISNIYNRKRHLKDKIKTLGEEQSMRYLSVLG